MTSLVQAPGHVIDLSHDPAEALTGSTLLVASGGGHLSQLHQLRPRLTGLGDVTWVTFDTPQARSLLAGERVVFVRYTAPRDMRAVLANTRTARRLLQTLQPAHVVSTGSAIALSFLPLASATGASCHYIESATRVVGPSATGRLLSRIPRINLYNQHPNWEGPRWRYAGSVFDGWQATPAGTAPSRLRRAVVSLGTMQTYGFRRMVEALLRVLPKDVETLWQTGCTNVRGLPIDARPTVSARELESAMREADLVVTHAGTGSALTALEAGKLPILLPRTAARGEHIDDHQHQVAQELKRRGLAVTTDPDLLTETDLERATTTNVTRVDAPPPIRLVKIWAEPMANTTRSRTT